MVSVLPGQRGLSTQNLWRMRQFHDAYVGDARRSSLVLADEDAEIEMPPAEGCCKKVSPSGTG